MMNLNIFSTEFTKFVSHTFILIVLASGTLTDAKSLFLFYFAPYASTTKPSTKVVEAFSFQI